MSSSGNGDYPFRSTWPLNVRRRRRSGILIAPPIVTGGADSAQQAVFTDWLLGGAAPSGASVVGVQTLGSLSQSASAVTIAAALASQELGSLSQSATAAAVESLLGGQTLSGLSQAATAGTIAQASANQTLSGLTQVATAGDGAATASVVGDQTLGGLTQTATAVNNSPTYIPIGFGYVHTYPEKKKRRAKKAIKKAVAAVRSGEQPIADAVKWLMQALPDTTAAQKQNFEQALIEAVWQKPADREQAAQSQAKPSLAKADAEAVSILDAIAAAKRADDEEEEEEELIRILLWLKAA